MTGAAVPEELFLVFRPRAASEGLRWCEQEARVAAREAEFKAQEEARRRAPSRPAFTWRLCS